MNILITNDDGYNAKGIHVLAEIMCQFGNVTVIAPKYHQSGMSMAVSLGLRQAGKMVLFGRYTGELCEVRAQRSVPGQIPGRRRFRNKPWFQRRVSCLLLRHIGSCR